MFKELLTEIRAVTEDACGSRGSGMSWNDKKDMLMNHGWEPLYGASSKWRAPGGREYSTAWLDNQSAKEFKDLLKKEKI